MFAFERFCCYLTLIIYLTTFYQLIDIVDLSPSILIIDGGNKQEHEQENVHIVDIQEDGMVLNISDVDNNNNNNEEYGGDDQIMMIKKVKIEKSSESSKSESESSSLGSERAEKATATTLHPDIEKVLLDVIEDEDYDINNLSTTTISPSSSKNEKYSSDDIYDSTLKCDPKTEILSNCANSCPPSCEDPDRKRCSNFCWKGCECLPGFVKNINWKCIPKEDCPKCEINEHYRTCGPSCQPTCLTYQNLPVYCDQYNCRRGCFCNYGFVRETKEPNSSCIPIEQCPQKCGPNEYWDVNGEPCVRTAENPRPSCLFEKSEPKCVCNTGYHRNPKTKKCIPITKTEIKCSLNETYSQCGTECAQNCFDDSKRIKCPTVCNRGCFCKPGYKRDPYGTGRCVLPEDCNSLYSNHNTPILLA